MLFRFQSFGPCLAGYSPLLWSSINWLLFVASFHVQNNQHVHPRRRRFDTSSDTVCSDQECVDHLSFQTQDMLHPYRKRKFFNDLARILHEPEPFDQLMVAASMDQSLVPRCVTFATPEPRYKPQNQRPKHGEAPQQQTPSSVSTPEAAQEQQAQDEEQQRHKEQVHEQPQEPEQEQATESTNISVSSVCSSSIEESYEYVHFASDQSMEAHGNNSSSCEQDSLRLFQPPVTAAAAACFAPSQTPEKPGIDTTSAVATLSVPKTTTTLVNPRLAGYSKHKTGEQVELMDYLDHDRVCEEVPCWLFPEQTWCAVHNQHEHQLHNDQQDRRRAFAMHAAPCDLQGVAKPMLLFCLQTLDEYIAFQRFGKHHQRERFRVSCCIAARAVLLSHYASSGPNDNGNGNGNGTNGGGATTDIDLDAFVSRKKVMTGVPWLVWHIIEQYWQLHRQNFVHQDHVLFAVDHAKKSRLARQSGQQEWHQVRPWFQLFGMKPSHVHRILDLQQLHEHQYRLDLAHAIDMLIHNEQLEAENASNSERLVTSSALQMGLELARKLQSQPYLQQLPRALRDAEPPLCWRFVVPRRDWRIAFTAICFHLQREFPALQCFPCGSFARHALYGSVLDLLVSVPLSTRKNCSTSHDDDDEAIGGGGPSLVSILGVLIAKEIVLRDSVRQLSATRAFAIVSFKNVLLLLDLKCYAPPKSWFALVYFTGSEQFVVKFLQQLMGQSLLLELRDTSFERVYAHIVSCIGLERVNRVECEQDVFELATRQFVSPARRL